MTATSPLPKLFGPYVLTHRFESDPLGETYRAGTAAGKALAPMLLVRIFSGADIKREALLPVMEDAVEHLELVRGPAVAKGAVLGIVDEVPFAGIEYVPGRTLDRLLGGDGQDPVALPIEHALLIGEKILISLEAGKAFEKKMGAPHGFVVPAFISISNDGDVRVFGPGLGAGLLPSLKAGAAKTAFGPYIAPEVLASGKPSVAGDIYSMAAILFECLTGKPPTTDRGVDPLEGANLALNGNPLPDDLKKLVARGLAQDPVQRERDVVSYRKQLGKLLYAGPYAPSTFNLAFFMHQRFEKVIERERKELAAEEQIEVAPLQAAEEARDKAKANGVTAQQPREPEVPTFGMGAGEEGAGASEAQVAKKGGVPIPAIVAVVVVLAGAGFLLTRGGGTKAPSAPPPTPAVPVATPTQAPPPTPIIVGKGDPEFQAALKARLLEDFQRDSAQISREQEALAKKRAADLQRAAEEAGKARDAEAAARAARDRADNEEEARLSKEAEEARAREDSARKAAEAAVPTTKEGDIVELTQVDRPPSTTKIVKPEPTAPSRQRHVNGTVLIRVLVDENGKPAQVEILRDTTPKAGLGEASRDAIKKWEWTPAMKDGKRVKTWIAVPIPFKGL